MKESEWFGYSGKGGVRTASGREEGGGGRGGSGAKNSCVGESNYKVGVNGNTALGCHGHVAQQVAIVAVFT